MVLGFVLAGNLNLFCASLRASSPIWASEAGLARTRERATKPRGAEERTACNDLSQNFICTSLRRRQIPLDEKWRSGKTNLNDNRPSWHLLRQRDKFGSQGDQIGTDNLFQPSKQTWGSLDLVLAKRTLRAEDKSDRVFSSCGRKMKTLPQLLSFVSSAFFSSENEKSESEERFKRPVQALPSNVGFFAQLNSTG